MPLLSQHPHRQNGHNAQGQQQYWCKDCGIRAVLELRPRCTEEEKEQIIADYHERASMRGVEYVFGVSRQTLAAWLKKKGESSPSVKDTLLPVDPDDRLELDEMWSFVLKKVDKRWLWIALCRRTRQVAEP